MTASFTIRIVEALGASAHSVAAYVLVVDIFPNNIGTVRVSCEFETDRTKWEIWIILGAVGNLRRTGTKRWTRNRRTSLRGNFPQKGSKGATNRVGFLLGRLEALGFPSSSAGVLH